MGSQLQAYRAIAVVFVLFVWGSAGMNGQAAEKIAGLLTVHDALTLPNHSVQIDARLTAAGPADNRPLEGVPLHLRIDGKDIATGTTNEAGQVSFEYLPKMRGTNVISLSVDPAASVSAETREATLCVWERRRPIVLVEVESLLLGGDASLLSGSTENGEKSQPEPVPEAADELSKLTQYYYNVVYVSGGAPSLPASAAGHRVRQWLKTHKFPAGFVAVSETAGLSATVDRFKQEGWTTMKSGIGRTRSFAETLLQHRLEVVVVPELPKGQLPRKAKGAHDWKEVRKKL
ncbi:MAG: hypothetical protein GDA68_06585 [Nitrospira sp. CR2.1]|nr:hypothetical protein [Nitrospira sp. CR2.1]